MGTFQLENDLNRAARDGCGDNCCDIEGSFTSERNEGIVAFKLYDLCRQQDCLTHCQIGPARDSSGAVITPPSNAASVTIENLSLSSIKIVSKVPSPFRDGYWDVEIKYVFSYTLTFYDATGNVIGSAVSASNTFTKKVNLFGSTSSDFVVTSDLPGSTGQYISSNPYVMVEAKAVPLAADLKYPCDVFGSGNTSAAPNEVWVSIGLFTIIKLIRMVDLCVRSMGFCVPHECEDITPINPCDLFDKLSFPFDVFSPPQKPEFMGDF